MPNYLPGAEPFFFPGNRVGCLLIHGFTGTPYEMRGLGERLAQEGYTVSGPVLAGHATCLEDMAKTRWSDWYASATEAYGQLARDCDDIFPIGLSLGGVLALHLSAHCRVNGVVAVSPPFAIKNSLILFFRVFPFLFTFFPYVRKDPSKDDTQDKTVRAKHPAYDGNPTRCAASLVLDLLPHIKTDLPKISAPVLLIQSHQDQAIAPDSIDRYYEKVASTDRRKLWLENSGHLVLEDYAKDQAFAAILEFVRAHTAQGDEHGTH